MGIAASSALRDDTGANGSAYGSLEALGGPRKFKKKPVLVLAPEELEAAHALFHEASAQMLGEETERAPRPVSILGLAPMHNDPEELGRSDELADGAEDDMPSPEAVLALTRRKSAALPDDDFGTLDGGADYDAFGDQGDVPDDGLIDDGFINDGLDLSTRIFPSLPIRPELAAEDAEYASPMPPMPSDQDAPDDGLTSDRGAQAEPEPDAEPDMHPDPDLADPDLDVDPGAMPPPFAFRPVPPVIAVVPAASAGKADVPAPIQTAPAPASAPVPTPSEAGTPPLFAPGPVPDQAPATAPRPARFDELNPAKDYETPEEVLDLDRWLAGEGPEAADPASTPEDANSESAGPAAPDASAAGGSADAAGDEDQAQTVITDDDRVDGYAFMRDARPRHAVLSAAQQGRQSALRAKLLRESEREAARLQAQQQAPAGNSLLARMWHWLRDLLG